MINIPCSTCLESFTSGCDISTTPCGHVFHTGCITRWLNQNDHCSQCREVCEIRQIIKLYFSESQTTIEENITINDLEQKRLKLEEKSQKCERELTAMKKVVLDCGVEINQVNQKCNKLEHEKLLMKLDWSKTEWNLKESTIEAYIRIEDLEKEVEEQKMMKLDWSNTELHLKQSINGLTKRIKDLEKEVDDQKWLWLDSNTEHAELEVKRPSDLSPSTNKSTNKGNKRSEDLEKQDGDQKMVDKTNSGLESKASVIEGASLTQARNHKDCPMEILADKENIGNVIDADLEEIFIATLDRLRIGIKSSSVLYIYCKDLWKYLNILSNPRYCAIYPLNIDKLENWLTLLENMNASDERLSDNQVSEMEIDFNDALKKLIMF